MQRNLKRLLLSAALALWAFIVLPSAAPDLHLTFFAPFLVHLCYERPKTTALWMACCAGLLMDAVALRTPFGFFALNYVLTLWLLYERKSLFFEESLFSLPTLTLLFSILSTLYAAILLTMFSLSFSLSWKWFLTDIIILPCIDALYALLWFTVPLHFVRTRIYRPVPYLLKRK